MPSADEKGEPEPLGHVVVKGVMDMGRLLLDRGLDRWVALSLIWASVVVYGLTPAPKRDLGQVLAFIQGMFSEESLFWPSVAFGEAALLGLGSVVVAVVIHRLHQRVILQGEVLRKFRTAEDNRRLSSDDDAQLLTYNQERLKLIAEKPKNEDPSG